MGKHSRLALMIAIITPVVYVFWILFVGTFSAHELEIGIIATLLAVAGTVVIDVQYPSRFAPSLRELLTAWRLPAYWISGTFSILKVAALDSIGAKRAKSLFIAVPFAGGKLHDERDVARRVLAVTYTTTSPDSIVLGINVSQQKLLVHKFERTPTAQITKALGAQA
jgi:multisubunit Na+/H+ antiporter MnhE subunit